DNRHEAKDRGADPEALRIRLQQTLRGYLGSAVEGGLDRERTGLRRGEYLRFAVHTAPGREHDGAGACLAHGLQHIPGDDRVLLEVAPRMVGPEAHVCI